MATEKKTFTGANNATATTATTGYSSFFVTAPETITHTTSWLPLGATSSVRVAASTASTATYASFTVTSTSTLALRQPFMVEVMPTTGTPAIAEFIASGTTRNLELELLPTGALRLKDAGFVTVWESAAGVIAANVPTILSIFYTGNATTGTIQVRVYNLADGTVRADSGLLTAQNTRGATTIIRSLAGKTRTATTAGTYLWGEPVWDTAATGLIPLDTVHRPFLMPSADLLSLVPMKALISLDGTTLQRYDGPL